MLIRQYVILLGLSTLTRWITLLWSRRIETNIFLAKSLNPHVLDKDTKMPRDHLEMLHGKAERTATRAWRLFITTLAISIPIGTFHQVAHHSLPRATTVAAYSAMAIMLIGIIASFLRRRTIVQMDQAIDRL